MKNLDQFKTVNEAITINRYDNGWMVEIGGQDKKGDWKTSKILCNTEDEVIALIISWNTKEINS